MANDTDIEAAIQTELDARAAKGFPERIHTQDGREVQLTPLTDLIEAQNRVRRRSRPRARLLHPVAE